MERNSNQRLLLRSAIKQRSGAVGTISPVTTSPDSVLQWGNRKRLRYMKVQLKDQETNKNSTKGNGAAVSISVQRTTARVDRRVVRLESNKVPNQPACKNNVNGHGGNGYINLRQRPACPAQRILRNSDSSSIGMKGNSTNGGGRGLASPATDNHQQQLQSNKNNYNNNGSVSSSSENKKGGSSSGSDGMMKTGVWLPRFEIGLTNKEKEEDFLAIKGSKLPQRPKKRAKLIQRNLNLVSPGSWLCDLTLERYEVREKKVSKKKPRGLKDMGSMDSDSSE